jgi:hypothetical protein
VAKLFLNGSFDVFEKEVTELVFRLPRELIDKLVRVLVLKAVQKIVFKMPVDTGRARGGVQVSIGRPGPKIPDSRVPLDPGGLNALTEAQSKLIGLPEFPLVIVEDNVSYVIYLEQGSSSQAPEGMFRASFNELVLEVSTLAAALES